MVVWEMAVWSGRWVSVIEGDIPPPSQLGKVARCIEVGKKKWVTQDGSGTVITINVAVYFIQSLCFS